MNETEALFQLIVVGASAGGVEALSKLVAALPADFPVPVVIAQHLDPRRPSHLAQILGRRSSLPVLVVEEREVLQHGTIYVVPSNHHIAITEHDVSVLPDVDGRPKPSIDLLLSSAAEVYGEKLIAVILTGTGSDGTLGAKTVHETGGTVLIQNPATAAYPGMPESVASETVDLVADLERIGPLLFDLVSGHPVPLQSHTARELEPFLDHLREHNGIDFRTYKPATILRRLQRRMLATDCSDLTEYKLYLQAHPEEYDQLVSDFLIKVTEFMRDPTLFNYLQERVLPDLIERSRTRERELRFWSAGCATGEEAYSLAILLYEVLGAELENFHIKIFATDLDINAIAYARRGLYPAKALASLPEELVQRYFTRNGEDYEVKKLLRNLIVFGEHDLGQSAPFPRIDLVMCRNVLIYFNRELQQHALQIFAFALRDGGYLVLGRTETTSPLPEFFAPQEPQQRIYRRHGHRRLIPPVSPNSYKPLTVPNLSPPRRNRISSALFQVRPPQNWSAKDNLLLKLPIGVVVVDQRFDIQEINSAARRLLSIHTSAIGEDFIHLAQNISPRELSTAITRAIQNNTVTTLTNVEVPHLTTGEANFLQITCYPHPATIGEDETEVASKYTLILVTDITAAYQSQRKLEQSNFQQAQMTAELAQSVTNLQHTNLELQQSNAQLLQTNAALAEAKQQTEEMALRHKRQMELLVESNRNLLTANEELTTLTADLRANNDEYMMHTEEAQAAIEEADTLNEELQATNEEFETLNEELQATVEELNTSNADLAAQGDELRKNSEELNLQKQLSERERAQLTALLASMSDAVVVVDLTGKVLLTNRAYEQLSEIAKGMIWLEEGSDEPLRAEDMPLARATRAEPFSMTSSFRLSDGSQHWWEAIGQPVRGNDAPDWGVVVLRDITERSLRRLQEQFSSLVSHELKTPLTVIKGYNELIQTWLEKQTGDFARPLKSVQQSLLQIGRLGRLIEDMIDVNRLQNGKFNLHFTQLRLDTLLEQVARDGQMLTTKQVINFDSNNEPLVVNGDAMRLQQVILNLINNAITYASDSPKIDLCLRHLDNEQAEIRVQDYGPGIKAEYQAALFSRFYQVARADGGNNAGLGLGLFIAQQIVVAHGGTLRVESSEGEGATFIVQLPLEPNKIGVQ